MMTAIKNLFYISLGNTVIKLNAALVNFVDSYIILAQLAPVEYLVTYRHKGVTYKLQQLNLLNHIYIQHIVQDSTVYK
jgi:hypothetical protein